MAEHRIYFNITNKCNTACPFCCVYSSPTKNTFMTFETFQHNISSICDAVNGFELRLEGGEPLLHPDFYLFLEYARYTNKCEQIIIATNGIILNKHLDRIISFVKNYNIPVKIVHSINYHLHNLDNRIFKKCRDLYTATEFVENFELRFNVRLRHDDEWIVEKLKEFKIYEQSYIFNFQNYGRWNEDGYEPPTISQNIDEWAIFSPDGNCFGHDLIARSEYERKLP